MSYFKQLVKSSETAKWKSYYRFMNIFKQHLFHLQNPEFWHIIANSFVLFYLSLIFSMLLPLPVSIPKLETCFKNGLSWYFFCLIKTFFSKQDTVFLWLPLLHNSHIICKLLEDHVLCLDIRKHRPMEKLDILSCRFSYSFLPLLVSLQKSLLGALYFCFKVG